MRIPGALTCPHCGAPTERRAPACAWCRGPLAWAPALPLEPLLPCDDQWVLSRGGPPGQGAGTEFQTTDHGCLFRLDPEVARWVTLPGATRHGVVGIRARTADPAGGFGLLARVSSTGTVRMGYALTVRPDARAFRLGRLLQDDRRNVAYDVLQDWTTTTAVPPLGEWCTAELRFADTAIEVWLGGTRAARHTDGAFGYGLCGWRIGAWDGPAEVEVAEVWRGSLR
ncbi:MAG: hypothetical protein ACI8PZ_001192 [Myxococcota bacterium]|jgi:hypothetical protein